MQLENRKGSRNGLWIVMVAAPSILLASGIKAGCHSSCAAGTPAPAAPAAPADTITTTTPGVGGQPGAFSGSATVTAPQEQAPQTDFNNLTTARNNIQSSIDRTREQIDNRALTPAERLDLTHKLDDLLNNKNALQYVIDAANVAANSAPGPAPSPPPPKDKKITNDDLATLGNFLRPGGPKPGGAGDLKNKLDLVDGANALKALFGN